MFDPLDFISPTEEIPLPATDPVNTLLSSACENEQDGMSIGSNNDVLDGFDDLDIPVQTIDLPYVQFASKEAILAVLLLLKPSSQVNFGQAETSTMQRKSVDTICKDNGILSEHLEAVLTWYQDWNNESLDTLEKICYKIPKLIYTSREQELLNYYTTILSKYNKQPNDELTEQILKQASLRISEKCGRTAQPSMTRHFQMDNLSHRVSLYEPSLTSDNLGLKTWGASLILSQKICNRFNSIFSSTGNPVRVLELGSGTGLVGITFSCKYKESKTALGSCEIYLTDLPEIVPNLQKNVEINNLNSQSGLAVCADVLDWTNPVSFTEKYGDDKFDVILIADPIYSPQHPVWVVAMIDKFLSEKGKVYLEVPIRPKYAQERQLLWSLLTENALVVVEEVYDNGVDDWGDVRYVYKEITREKVRR